jgi:hypothetical protein
MGEFCNLLKVRHVVPRVTNALNVDGLGLIVDGCGKLFGVVAVDELDGDAESGKSDLELVVSAAVQVGCRNDVVSGMSKC